MTFSSFSVGLGSPQLVVDAQRVWSGQVSADRRTRHQSAPVEFPPLPPTPQQPASRPLPTPVVNESSPHQTESGFSLPRLPGSRSLMNESPLASPEHSSGRRPSYASRSSRRSSRSDLQVAIPKSRSSSSLQLQHRRSSSSSLLQSTSDRSSGESSRHRPSPSHPVPDMGRNLAVNLSPEVRRSLNPSPLSTTPIQERDEPPSYSRRASHGTDLDDRIRQAEDRIRIAHRARPNAYPLSPDGRSPEKRVRDATLTVAEQLSNTKDTWKRSATASASSSGGDRSFERSAGRRRPLPAQFRQSLFSPPDDSPTRYRGSMDNLERASSRQWSEPSRREEPARRADFGRRQTPEQPTPSKDPLEVIRRIEAQREEHNRSWERSASALGHRPRASTSLSSLRDPPRTAPVDRIRTAQLRTPDIKSLQLGPEGTTEHGRLLYEAARSLELKVQDASLARTIHTAARSTETTNSAIRAALDLAAQMDAEPAHIQALTTLLRDSLRASDENVRSLTRLMLDLPKNAGANIPPTPRYERAETPARRVYDTPIRRSEDLPRPSTALADYTSGRRVRESLPASFSMDIGRATGSNGNGTSMRQSMRNSLFTVNSQAQASPSALQKRSSIHSTHTVRASNPFLPSSAGKVATTAVSNVTAGNIDASPTPSPRRDSWEEGASDGSEEDVLNTLVAAQRRREEEEEWNGADDGEAANLAAMDHDGPALAPATVPENSLDIGPVAPIRPSPSSVQPGKSFGTLGRSTSVRETSGRKWSVSDRFMATIRRTRDE